MVINMYSHPEHPSAAYFPSNLWEYLYRILIQRPKVLEQVLRDDYLPILDQLRGIGGAGAEMSIKFWFILARSLDLSEEELRAERRRRRQEARGGAVGCSWYKCAMYKQNMDQELFRCAGCERCYYCGERCQRR